MESLPLTNDDGHPLFFQVRKTQNGPRQAPREGGKVGEDFDE